MIQEPSLMDQLYELLRRIGHFSLDSAPYIGLVLLGHTVTSLDHHAGDWRWSTYLISCASTIVLGIALYCAASALKMPAMLGYALAVLAGRNTKDTLDVFSKDLLAWMKRGSYK